MTWIAIRQLLSRHYRAPLSEMFKQFRLGVGLFVCGLVVLYIAHHQISPSLKQEIVTLGGLMLIGIGFLTAMLAHVRMLISRLLNTWKPLKKKA